MSGSEGVVRKIDSKRYSEDFAGGVDDFVDFGELLKSNSSFSNVQENTIVSGVVTDIDTYDDSIIVDVGGKVEGKVRKSELALRGPDYSVEVGDVIDVYIDKIEGSGSDDGFAVFNIESVILEEKWEFLEEKHEKKEPVYGVIYQRLKGGCAVDLCGGVAAFLPGSQIDVVHVSDIAPLMNIKTAFVIISMNKATGNLVVSRRAILDQNRSKEREIFMENVEVGQILEGSCKGIADYGAFINFGCVDGLLHIIDMSWERICHPSEHPDIKIGNRVKVKVISLDKEAGKISLGMKQLTENPWDSVEEMYPVGGVYEGEITKIEKYGMFAKLSKGIEGLVHNSEISWSVPNVAHSELRKQFKCGQICKVRVLGYEIQNGQTRMSLSMKKLEDNPWEKFAKSHAIGTDIAGSVYDKSKDNIFVNIGENMVCRLSKQHIIDGIEVPEEELRRKFINCKVGDSVDAKVLSILVCRQRIYLSCIKDSFSEIEDFVKKLKEGDTLSGCIVRDVEKGTHVHAEYSEYAIPVYVVLPKNKKSEMVGCFIGERKDCFIKSIDYTNFSIICGIVGLDYEDSDFDDLL